MACLRYAVFIHLRKDQLIEFLFERHSYLFSFFSIIRLAKLHSNIHQQNKVANWRFRWIGIRLFRHTLNSHWIKIKCLFFCHKLLHHNKENITSNYIPHLNRYMRLLLLSFLSCSVLVLRWFDVSTFILVVCYLPPHLLLTDFTRSLRHIVRIVRYQHEQTEREKNPANIFFAFWNLNPHMSHSQSGVK